MGVFYAFNDIKSSVVAVKLNDSQSANLATITFGAVGDNNIESSGSVIITGVKFSAADQGQAHITLDNRVFYQSFGDKAMPVQINGLAFHSTCDTQEQGIASVLRFYSSNRPAAASSSGIVPTVTIQMGNNIKMRGVLQSCNIYGSSDAQSFGYFNFTLSCIMTIAEVI